MAKKAMEYYGNAMRVFVDWRRYKLNECIFYYRLLKKVVDDNKPIESNYFISGLKEIINQPGFAYKEILEQRFGSVEYKCVSDMAREIGITKQGLLLRFEKAYEYIRKQETLFDINKRMAILQEALDTLRNAKMEHEKEKIPNEESINALGLKKRSRTCLNSVGITTASQLLEITDKQIMEIPGAGVKTLEDILECQKRLRDAINTSCIKRNLDIDGLHLSSRASRCLDELNVKTVVDFLKLTKREVLSVWHIGKSTWEEIYQKQMEIRMSGL